MNKEKLIYGRSMHFQVKFQRGTYCALNTACLLNLLTSELIAGCADFIAQCQTYEGGLGPFPGVEGHGGYTFCGLAALCLINQAETVDLFALSVS
jgi:protein farnesyltransferase subunit beta